jgi:ubiquinone/menaquinone biosynthesis C-methylase UbiE
MTSESIYDVAEAIAATWERRRTEVEELSAPVRAWMVRELAPREGDTVLELAAGVGDTGYDAAALVGERGRLISSDFSPAMLAAARRRGAERGVGNVDYRIIDAERIELGDDSVDGVLCRFGYMIMDLATALAETRRVLRPGGRLALAVWGAPERNPWVALIAFSLVRRGHLPPPESPDAPGPFAMASLQRTTELLRGAGFADGRTEEVPLCLPVTDVDEYMALIADTAGPIALALRGLSEADRADVRSDVADSLGRFTAADGYELPGVALCALAR